ncbi:MAG: type I 3-dehydroquinate dehydratase, partial [Planctomycetes bacterium]|nr:type I 3-dehydroquinate dehydratase [Planctomycetota bacterium]
MLCVAIGRSRHKHMMAEHRHLVEQGAKMVELRLDYVTGRVNMGRLLAERPSGCQVIITVRRKEDGGKWSGSEESRQLLLREAIAEGVDYVDLEEDIAGLIPRFGQTKRIISYHNFRKTPEDLRELHTRMSKLDPDIVKIATMANDPHDTLRMLELMQESEIPTVAMCMGDIGTPSRILSPKFNAPYTYATFHHERTLAPGQLSFKQMKDIYRYESIGHDTEVYGVIADPVGHSLSPHVHNAAFENKGINAVYCPFRVPSDSLDQFMKDAPRLGIRGLSVTIPHKEAIARHLTKVDPAVKSIAAVNTVVFGLAVLLAGRAPLPPAPPNARASATEGSFWILPAIALSGAVSFAYEVLWTRLLGHLLGSGIHAFATMLAGFLLGIALGSAVAARLAATRARATLGFAWSQLGIA